MGQVFVVNADDLEWLKPPKGEFEVPSDSPNVEYKILSSPNGPVPGAQLSRFEPGHVTNLHSHPTSEVLYVLDGEVPIGDVRAVPGTMVFIEKETVYGPVVAGPTGAMFLRVEIG